MKKITVALACLFALGTASIALAHGGRGKHFEKLDANGDGKVTKAEHARAAEARFSEMDTNKDGVLTLEELKSGRGKHAGRGHGPGGSCDHEHGGKAVTPGTGAAGSAGR
jgi:hypothetical protein